MLASAVLFAAAEAPGQPSAPTRLQLDFKAPTSCARSVEFERRVKQRSDRIAFVTEPPYTGAAKVTLEPTPDSVRVRLSWSRDREGTTGREFNAASCAEAMDAAALVIAISFDPSVPDGSAAGGESEPTGASEPHDESSPTLEDPNQDPTRAQDSGRGPTEKRDSRAPAPTESAAPELARARAGAGAEPESDADALSVAFGSSAFVRGSSGVAPAPMAGVGLNLELAIGKDWLEPQLRLAGVHYFGNTTTAEGGDARFELDTLELFACPFRIGSEAFSVRPCATVVGGRLVASGRSTVEGSSHTRALWILGGALVAAVRPVSVLLVSADLTVGAPTTRDSFQFAPDTFHQISAVVVSGSLGLGVEFR